MLSFVFAISFGINAQIKSPQASTAQTINQTVGLTNMELSYSRPSMKGRTIFGGLVPYNKVWRTAHETGNVDNVLNGDIDSFLKAYLMMNGQEEKSDEL